MGVVKPMVFDHEKVIYRGEPGQPSIVAHIADTNTKLDYNNKRLDDLTTIGQAILALFQKVGWIAIRLIAGILILLSLWGVFGGAVKQKVHEWFPAWPMANKSTDPAEGSVEYPQDARSWTP